MQHSGKKLVVVLCLVAVAAGLVGWSYRYRSAHRAAEFWGPMAAMFIRGPSAVQLLGVDGVWHESSREADFGAVKLDVLRDVSTAKGLNHLRNALSLDRSFDWEDVALPVPVDWAVGIRFSKEDEGVTVFFSRDFRTLGKMVRGGETVETVSCAPMSAPLATYFESFGR